MRHYCQDIKHWNKKVIYHFGMYNDCKNQPIAVNSNAGDTLLFQATKDVFDKFLGVNKWVLQPLWKRVTETKIAEINTKGNAVVIGGGGLFLRDQIGAEDSCSGWQWNCPIDLLSKFRVPLILFGVGYNRFRNQADFDSIFFPHIRELIKNSSFFGLRNWGSIKAIKKNLSSSTLKRKISYQPCPTTLSFQLYQNELKFLLAKNSGKKLSVNIAFDRKKLRYGKNEDKILRSIARAINKYQNLGWIIVLVNHKPQDAQFSKWLKEEKVIYKSVDLSKSYPKEIIQFYHSIDLAIGARGHAQLIPFGIQKNIISIISHDKLRWFLKDIGYPNWGVDVKDVNFEKKLELLLEKITTDKNRTNNKKVVFAQKKLYQVTKKNMKKIEKIIK